MPTAALKSEPTRSEYYYAMAVTADVSSAIQSSRGQLAQYRLYRKVDRRIQVLLRDIDKADWGTLDVRHFAHGMKELCGDVERLLGVAQHLRHHNRMIVSRAVRSLAKTYSELQEATEHLLLSSDPEVMASFDRAREEYHRGETIKYESLI